MKVPLSLYLCSTIIYLSHICIAWHSFCPISVLHGTVQPVDEGCGSERCRYANEEAWLREDRCEICVSRFTWLGRYSLVC